MTAINAATVYADLMREAQIADEIGECRAYVIIKTSPNGTMKIKQDGDRLREMAQTVLKNWSVFGGGPKPEINAPKRPRATWKASHLAVWREQLENGNRQEAARLGLEKLGARFVPAYGSSQYMVAAGKAVGGMPADIQSFARCDGMFVVMDIVSGRSLDGSHKTRAMAEKNASKLWGMRTEEQCAAALQIARRDIKPQAQLMADWCAAHDVEAEGLPIPAEIEAAEEPAEVTADTTAADPAPVAADDVPTDAPTNAPAVDLSQFVKIAADDVSRLRTNGADAFRVLSECPAEHRHALADYMHQARPDLSDDIRDALADIPTDAPRADAPAVQAPPASVWAPEARALACLRHGMAELTRAADRPADPPACPRAADAPTTADPAECADTPPHTSTVQADPADQGVTDAAPTAEAAELFTPAESPQKNPEPPTPRHTPSNAHPPSGIPDATRMTFAQWVEAKWQATAYRCAYLEDEGGNLQQAKMACAAGGSPVESVARSIYWRELIEAPRDAVVSLDVFQELNPGQQTDAKKHFFRLESDLMEALLSGFLSPGRVEPQEGQKSAQNAEKGPNPGAMRTQGMGIDNPPSRFTETVDNKSAHGTEYPPSGPTNSSRQNPGLLCVELVGGQDALLAQFPELHQLFGNSRNG